ncbi:methyltransferase domain-containing protein [Candidatus Bathyarchaeota archaeon]|nr:methyltransferase domain-containing protein [Candidatus Bathyarchaeota archaeon]
MEKEAADVYSQENVVEKWEFFHTTKYGLKTDTLEKAVLNKLMKKLGSVTDLLEVGCGTGHFTRWFESLGLNCCGFDLSHLMLKKAKSLSPHIQSIQGDASLLPFKDKSFDVVAYTKCLEFIPDIAKALREGVRVARKGMLLGLMNGWSFREIRRNIILDMGWTPFFKHVKSYSILEIWHVMRKTFYNKHTKIYWSTTVFPKTFLFVPESSLLPLGSFLGVAVRLKES